MTRTIQRQSSSDKLLDAVDFIQAKSADDCDKLIYNNLNVY
jgi:hypothetical protein